MMRAPPALLAFLRRLRDNSGAASVEFALVMGTLTTLMLNGLEVGRFYFIKMEVENAAQMAAQSVWKTCDGPSENPVTIRCNGRTNAITRGLQSTTLGNNVTLATGFPTEAYFCVSTETGALTKVGEVANSRPADCSAAGSATDIPGNYVAIRAEYTYAPMFRGLTIGSRLPTNIRSTTTMRIR